MIRTRAHGVRKFFPARAGKRTLGKRHRYLSWLWGEVDEVDRARAKDKKEAAREIEEQMEEVDGVQERSK